jgi:hypothetical protein
MNVVGDENVVVVNDDQFHNFINEDLPDPYALPMNDPN